MVKYAMAIDLNRCMGCRACMVACKVENNTSTGVFWMNVFKFEEGEYPSVRNSYLPRPCMHCDNAPCVKVCPVGARYKQTDGLVLTDFDLCIGCRYCEISCPYSVNSINLKRPEENQYFDWSNGEGDNVYGEGKMSDYVGDNVPPYSNPDLEELYGEDNKLVAGGGHYQGVIEKCTWCIHRVEKGLDPACVANCPAFAMAFGDLDDPESEVSKVLTKKPHFRLLEEIGTEPRVFYLGQPPPTSHVRVEITKAEVKA
jgi:molybdopterin-containing oxidoreductase family iron-sulfur binding subunit